MLPPATKLGQGYVFTGVCHSVNRGDVCLSACWDTTPPEQTPRPPGADTLLQEQTPPVQSMLGNTVNARAVRILLECNLVFYATCKQIFIILYEKFTNAQIFMGLKQSNMAIRAE